MDTTATTISTMGIISDEVYKATYFIDEYNVDEKSGDSILINYNLQYI
jgi:hypothetical protein